MKKSRRTKKAVSRKPVSRKAVPKAVRKIAVKRARKQDEFTKCLRCNLEFASRAALKNHLKMHNQALREIKLLEEGHVPIESKIGFEFKGKNRIIIS